MSFTEAPTVPLSVNDNDRCSSYTIRGQYVQYLRHDWKLIPMVMRQYKVVVFYAKCRDSLSHPTPPHSIQPTAYHLYVLCHDIDKIVNVRLCFSLVILLLLLLSQCFSLFEIPMKLCAKQT